MSTPNHSSNQAPRPGGSPDGAEPVTQLERGVHGDNETTASPTNESTGEFRTLAMPTALPPWLAEKFHWQQSASGRAYLQPNTEFLAAVETDAPKFQEYGYRCLIGQDGKPVKSEERKAVDDMSSTFALIRESLMGFDESEREENALRRYLLERVTSNLVYAAITQFEIDNWAARAASAGKDASDHQNFGEKQARRDEFAHNGAVFHAVLMNVFPDVKIDASTYAKQARQLIYQQARMRTQELASPEPASAQEQQARAAAVMAARPFA